MLYSSIHHELINKGYHVGTFNDFWLNDNGITEEEWHWAINVYKNSFNEIEELYTYRHNYLDQNLMNYLKNISYTGPWPTEEDKESDVPYFRKNIRKDFINKAIAGGANIRTTQQWAWLNLSKGKNGQNLYKMQEIFNKLVKNFCCRIYNHLEQNKNIVELSTQFSIYSQGDFSEVHYDGTSPGRQCVIIMYFSNPQTYQNSGGRLIITKTNKYRSNIHNNPQFLNYLIESNNSELDFVLPVYGNYAILDFTKHDLGHAIEVVNDNFIRFALQVFLRLPNE